MTTESRLASPSARGPVSTPASIAPKTFAQAVLLTTAVAGTLDIIAAHLHIWAVKGRFPATLFKSIAGGALGMARAKQGGMAMIALGAFFHYFIAFAFTLLFFLLYPRLGLLRKNRYVVGAGYATFVSTVMDHVVLPLSAFSAGPPDYTSAGTYIGRAVLILVFGIPISICAASYYGRSDRAA